MLRKLIQWLLRSATFSIYESKGPIGRFFGTHKLPYDYIIIDIKVGGEFVLLGHFKKV